MERSEIQVNWVLFDFGGVLADEGFRGGLEAIASEVGYDPDAFFAHAERAIYDSAYVLGRGSEQAFWAQVRERFPLEGIDDTVLSAAILERFQLRPSMLHAVNYLRHRGWRCALLSDQTDWLEHIDRHEQLYRRFDKVFNSYRTGRSKRESRCFDAVTTELGLAPEQILFLDDNAANLERAAAVGWRTAACNCANDCLHALGQQLGIPAVRLALGVLSAGVVPVQIRPEGARYLLLRCYDYWDFPKGLVEADEMPREAARREVMEETALDDLEFLWGDRYIETEPYGRFDKVARYYLAVTHGQGVSLPVNPELGRAEHHEYRWVDFAEAHALLNDRLRPVLQWADALVRQGRGDAKSVRAG